MGVRRWRTRDRLGESHLPAHRGGGSELSRRNRPEWLPGLIDSHCHLQHERFDADRDEVIDRAVGAGIERIMVPGWDVRSSVLALELAERHRPLIHAAVGVHPHHAAGMDERGWRELEGLAAEPRCSAIGEIGLDFFRNLSAPDVQAEVLERQLDIATERDLPILVHDRDAHAQITGALEGWVGRPSATARGVLHAYSGDAEMAATLSGRGFLLSFALPVTFRSAGGPRSAAARIGSDAFLVETDAPYLGSDASGRNEPTTALRVASELAALRGVDIATVVADVRRAYDRLIVH
ncbi:MAG: TatD family hydrolase [Candidatus Limnocylindria bacterium]